LGTPRGSWASTPWRWRRRASTWNFAAQLASVEIFGGSPDRDSSPSARPLWLSR
jgi:hypothetical protein